MGDVDQIDSEVIRQKYGTAPWVSGLSLRQAALIAGLTYLINPVTFAETYAMPHLVVSDPGQTMANIAAHPHLFAAAVLSYFFSLFGDLILAWSLYVLLAPVNRALSMLAAWLQMSYAAVSMAAVSNLGLLYRLVVIPGYSGKMSAGMMPTQGTLLLGAFRSGWGLGLILFGLHLVVLGWLMTRSSYLPRWLGWLLFLDGLAWIVDSLSVYLFPNASLGFLNVFFASELIFMVWLLGWGWRISEPLGTE
jgi:hypothetical protein